MPYDRARTSMRRFAQCPECLREYGSPDSRRYHAESNSCPACGPRVWIEAIEPAGAREDAARRRGSQAAIRRAAALLRAGKIVAVRGLGGFHLAVDATSDAAVARLRARKGRDAKPLAVMVRTPADARRLGAVSALEAGLLRSRERPIVLLRRARGSPVAPSVAPGLDTVGVMTAYTPLHHLLLEAAGRPLVMTSGNRTEEPIATANDEARRRLAGIADAYLDRSPLVALTAQEPLSEVHKESHQYVDVVRLLAPITKWSARVENANVVPEIIRKAFKIAQAEKPGSTHVELPVDVAEAQTKAKPIPWQRIRRPSPDRPSLDKAARLIGKAKRPMILAGNGVIRGGATPVMPVGGALSRRATPKSDSWKSSARVSSTFPGLRSRWITPCSCAYSSARLSLNANSTTFSTGSSALAVVCCARVPPGTYSITT